MQIRTEGVSAAAGGNKQGWVPRVVVEQEIARLSIRVPVRVGIDMVSSSFVGEGSDACRAGNGKHSPAQSRLENVFLGERRVNARHAPPESLERGGGDLLLLVAGSEDCSRKGRERTGG